MLDDSIFKCPLCKNKIFGESILYKKNNKIVISGEFAFHLYDTHGIDIKTLVDKLNDSLRRDSENI